jgi:hypothetical protein
MYVEPPLHSWDEATLVMEANDLSEVLLDLVCHNIHFLNSEYKSTSNVSIL